MVRLACPALVAAWWFAACNAAKDSGDTGSADADTDTDTDADADADTDADTDTDADADADSDSDTDADTDTAGISTVPIASIQGGLIAERTDVVVEGVVTGTAYNGLYVQDGPGPLSGIWVFASAGWEATFGAASRGDRVRVTGNYQEYNGLSELSLLDAAAPAIVALGAVGEPEPHVITVADLLADPEPWEGVLLRVPDTSVAEPNLGLGEFSVVDGAGNALVVDDQMHWYSLAAAGTLSPGHPFVAITGTLNYAFGAYVLEPRDEADLVSPVDETGHTGAAPTGDTAPAPTGDTAPAPTGDTAAPTGDTAAAPRGGQRASGCDTCAPRPR